MAESAVRDFGRGNEIVSQRASQGNWFPKENANAREIWKGNEMNEIPCFEREKRRRMEIVVKIRRQPRLKRPVEEERQEKWLRNMPSMLSFVIIDILDDRIQHTLCLSSCVSSWEWSPKYGQSRSYLYFLCNQSNVLKQIKLIYANSLLV